MASSAIVSISSNSTDEMWDHQPPPGFIFCDIPTVIPSTSVVAPETSTIAPVISSAAPMVETTLVASPTGLTTISRTLMLQPLLVGGAVCNSTSIIHHLSFPIAYLLLCQDVPPRISSTVQAILIQTLGGYTFGRPSTAPQLNWPQSSSGDSSERPMHSSSRSAGPSRKRCRSPVDFVPSSMPVIGSLAPTHADLLPPSLTTSKEVGIDPVSASIVKKEIVEPARKDSSDSSGTRDGIVRSFEDMPIDLNDVVHDFYHHMSEVRIDRIVGIETVQRRLEADQLIARGQRVSMIERIDRLRLENLKVRAMLDIESDRVNNLCLYMSLSQEARRDRDDTRERLRKLESTMTNTRSGMTPAAIEEMINQRVDAALELVEKRNGNGNGNGTRNGNNGGDNGDGNENRNVNGRGDRHVARECTYQYFMKCQPLSFKGTEGVVGLIRWSEKMETVFHISNCPERYQVKYDINDSMQVITRVVLPTRRAMESRESV
ncbi:hypothetical protein Tco_0706269 [Tanacetum coccineum]|uniref:Reverse transcriptase domain-containing protein n=1 Tax=Tanacetum coccineum TaxID=301880 RepID=A0ABQ4Y909_9ASTR